MSGLTTWLSPHLMRALGWTLLNFLWQGTALAALAAVLMNLCSRAAARYLLAVGVLVLMLAAPIASFFLSPSVESVFGASSAIPSTQPPAVAQFSSVTSRLRQVTPRLHLLPWLVEAWLFGVTLFGFRSVGGFLLIERDRRRQSTSPAAYVLAICRMLQQSLGIERDVRYFECYWLDAPAVIGWFRPIVLLPVTALTGLSEEQLQSVIAHELAHIQRFDAFINLFQIGVETLLFYHPAVWWLNHRIRIERENCCDDAAVSLCGNAVEYARALTLMEEWRKPPAFAMAANRGPLSARIFRLLGRKTTVGATCFGLAVSLLSLTAAMVAGNALLGVAYPQRAHAARVFEEQSEEQSLKARVVRVALSPQTSVSPAANKPSPERAQEVDSEPATRGSYIDGLRAAGLENLSVDELVELKIHEVTSAYVREMHDQGLHPSVDELVAMRIQGVTPELIRDLKGMGLNPDVDQIVALKIQGIDAAYVRGLHEAGIQPDADHLVAMKIQGITPAYVHDLRELGLHPDVNDLVGMKIQGVTPEYMRAIHSLGLTPTAEELTGMRIQGITPEFIQALQTAGLKFDVDDVINAKVQDITPEFIQNAIKRGFQNLTVEKLIELKHMGILESRGEI